MALGAGVAEARIRVPDGVRVQRAVTGIPRPTNLAFDPRGRLWVTSAGYGTAPADGVWVVRRRGEPPRQVVRGLYTALGVAWHRGELYVSHVTPNRTSAPRHVGRVVGYSGFDGRRFRRARVVVDGIPTGLHRVDSLALGPDGRLYLGVGSQFDHERSPHAVSGTVVSFRPDGGDLRVEARGLRNPYGLAFVPGTRELLVTEHGRDDLGLRVPPEEVNLVNVDEPVAWYGFPECWGQGGDPCAGARDPLVRFAPHSAPGGVVVVRRFGRWGPSAFVARFGSSFRGAPTGGDVVRVALARRDGRLSGRVRRFATGLGRQQPLGVALGPGGALHVTRWRSGDVVRFVPPAPRRPRSAPLLRARVPFAPGDDPLGRLLAWPPR